MARRWVVWLSMAVALAGCTQPSAAPVPSAGDVTPAVQQAAPAAPVPKDARLLRPDPSGRYIADVDRQLRVLDYEGQMLTQFELEGAPVQEVVWSPGGDQLLVITGTAMVECCDLFREARYWLLPVPQGAPRELTGLPQEVIFSWPADEQSLYVLDNWRRQATQTEHGERLQRYDLATGQLTLLLPNRLPRTMSVEELPGGDLLIGQYAGGGHAGYSRLPAGSTQLVKSVPFHKRLSPDKRWAAEANLWSQPQLAVANVATGEVVRYQPDTPWPPPGEKGNWPVSDPEWDEESRWLLYTVQGGGEVAPELRFFDRTKAEHDRMIPDAVGVWLPGPGLQALVFRHSEGSVQPWRYDVVADRFLEPVGPKAAASGGEPGNCEPVGNMRVTPETAAYLTCDKGAHTFWMIDLTGRVPPLELPLDRPAWVLSLDAGGKRAALAILTDPGGMELRLVGLSGK